MKPAVNIIPKHTISDHIAGQLGKMAEKFFSKTENVEKFNEWHKEKFGYEAGSKANKEKEVQP